MGPKSNNGDLTRVVLAVLFIGALIAASLWILQPFIGALIWAVMIVIPTWPTMLALEKTLGGRRWAAVTAMSLILLLLLLVPLFAAIGTVLANLDDIAGWAKVAKDFKLPPPPAWLAGLPLVGAQAVQLWQEVAVEGFSSLASVTTPYAGDVARWLVARVGGLGTLFLQFLLTVVACAVLYGQGEHAAHYAYRFGSRLAGRQGEDAIVLSAQAIRGVALGVVVTALIQALIAAVGLFIARVPFAALLTALVFLLSVAQLGGALVLVIPVAWLYWSGHSGWGTFMLVILIVTATIDNFIRPVLIRRGADLPLLLIFIGVIGGLIGFGLIGIFVGPVVLAVGYTLLRAWLGMEPGQGAQQEPRATPSSPSAPPS
jgi:predicted PurR-regulated permease PerM